MEAEIEAKSALDNALKNHKQLKVQIAEKKAANDNYQKQVEVLLEQKLTLQANLSAAGEPQNTQGQPVHFRISKGNTDLYSCFYQMTLAWFVHLGGSLTTHPATSFPSLNPALKRTGQIAGPTVPVATRTWLWSITRRSRWDLRNTYQNLNFPIMVNFSPSLVVPRHLWVPLLRACLPVPRATRSGWASVTQRQRASGFGLTM